MFRYIALLRAINVGGHTVKMERLRQLFEALGFTRVETFIASGNVIFETRRTTVPALEKKIERHLRAALGYEVTTFIRTPAELAAVAAQQPFAPGDVAAPDHSVYVIFLAQAPSPEARQALLNCRNDFDEFHIEGREIYWLRRVKLSDPNYPGPPWAKIFGRDFPTTMRNATTVRKLAAKYAEPARVKPK